MTAPLGFYSNSIGEKGCVPAGYFCILSPDSLYTQGQFPSCSRRQGRLPSLLRRYTVVFVDIALACYYNKKVKMAFVRRLAAAPNK